METKHRQFQTFLFTVIILTLFIGGFAQASEIYVSCGSTLNGTIQKIDSGGSVSTFASYSMRFFGLAFGSSDALYASTQNYIYKYDLSGNRSIFATNPKDYINGSANLIFDKNSNLYAAFFGDGWGPNISSIYKIDSSGNKTYFAGGYGMYGITFDSFDNLYAAGNADGTIVKFDSLGNGSVFATGLSHPVDVAFDSAGFLYVSNSDLGTIVKFDSLGNSSVFASGLSGPMGLAFDSSGSLYVANNINGTVMKYDSSGAGSVFASGLNNPTFIAVIPEPATMMLLAIGGLAILGRRRI